MREFTSKVRIDEDSGCWLWTASVKNTGYGQFKFNGKPVGAHRVSFMLFCGDIPPGMLVCHHCDVRRCVNPEHLYLGTHSDNLRDAFDRTRFAKTHCVHGHELAGENLRLSGGKRICRACARRRSNAWKKAHRATACYWSQT